MVPLPGHPVQDSRGAPDEPVGHGHLVQVGLRPVDKVGVGSPDPVQELPVQHQLVHLDQAIPAPPCECACVPHLTAVEDQPLVSPVLAEVDVQGEDALGLVHLEHGAVSVLMRSPSPGPWTSRRC